MMLKGNYEFVRLEPIDTEEKVKAEMDRVMTILEFEVAERVLLGAQFRKHEVGILYCYAKELST